VNLDLSARILATATVAGALIVGAGAARADGIALPAMIPDACFFGHCLQFTHTTAAASVQQVLTSAKQLENDIEMLKGMKVNLQTIKGQWTTIKSDVTGLKTSVGSAFPSKEAADAYDAQANSAASHTAQLNTLSDASQGHNQIAQTGNMYLSQIDEEVQKGNALQAAALRQHEAEIVGDTAAMFGMLNSVSDQPQKDKF
jgi:hypothetical protein